MSGLTFFILSCCFAERILAMSMKTKLLTVMSVFGVLAAVAIGLTHRAQTAQAKAAPGAEAPVFSLTDTAGKAHALSDYAGKTVVLHWQSMKCPWDVGYQPVLSKLAEQYEGKDVVFLAINSNYREHGEGLTAYHTGESMPYPILLDEDGAVAEAFDAKVTPHMFVIDGTGKLVYHGGVEKSPRSPRDAGTSETQYLSAVLAAVSAGESSPYDVTTPKGCGIKRR